MKIRKIEIVGFKSFLDKASIALPSGICAIVGPNGCGKSNVIDALRWVMGEQSVKRLRGKSMEDIIFAGANGKPPLNMAEVTLTMANDNGHAPEEFRDYAEISVTRRLFRSGESAYLINRQPCRLKDIYNLFMGSGVGTRTFSIIQQGNIGTIIDAGPDERRLFIEEAAGVTRYKFRKNEALRKVKATGNNLLRINDIISEVNLQMAGLRRQAKKAERFKNYQQRIRQIDTRLLLHYYDGYTQQMDETRSLLNELKDAEIGQATSLQKIDAAIEEIKLKRQRKDQEIATQKSDKFNLQRKVDRTEADLAHLKEEIQRLSAESADLEQSRLDLQSRTEIMSTEVAEVKKQNEAYQADVQRVRSEIETHRESASKERDQLHRKTQTLETRKASLMTLVAEEARYKNIYQNAAGNKETLERRLVRANEQVALNNQKAGRVQTEREKCRRRYDEIQERIRVHESRIAEQKKDLEEQASRLSTQVKKTQTLELEHNQARSQLTTLEKMEANFDWYRDGVRAVMQGRQETDASGSLCKMPLKGVVGLLADAIEPTAGYETAVEAVLGESLQYILVQDQEAGTKAIDFLRRGDGGRSGFIPMDSVKTIPGTSPEQILGQNSLLNHLTIKKDYLPFARALMGHVAVADTLAEALELFNRNGRVQSIVTRCGDVVSPQGLLIGGSQDRLAGILAKKQELKTVEQRCAHLTKEHHAARSCQQELEKKVRALETGLQRNIAAKNDAAAEHLEAEKALYRAGEDLKTARRNLEIVQLEEEQLLGEESDLEEQMAEYNQALARITSEVEAAQAQTTEATRQISRLTSRLENYNQQVVDLKLQLTASRTRLENGTQTLNRLKEFENDSRVRLTQLGRELIQKQRQRTASQSRVAIKDEDLRQMYGSLKHLDKNLSDNESEYQAIDLRLQKNDGQLASIQFEHRKTMEKMRLLELELSEKRIMRDNIAGKCKERYHTSIDALRMQIAPQEEHLQMSIEEMETELERYRSRLDRIGDVNLGAIQEYEALKERFEFLNTQRNDLEKAIEGLHKVIRKINRITQRRFVETFDQVNAKLNEVFPKLFEGGSARLELTAPDKPLETGVEYLVHPPGKRLTRMSLLSGGEKALAAIAFIFAIFLIRPASFCLLDEIDAPLDDANVVRFNNLMQVIGRKSQIVMITHNKRTMEYAQTLFGVTMEQKGISKVVSVNIDAKHA